MGERDARFATRCLVYGTGLKGFAVCVNFEYCIFKFAVHVVFLIGFFVVLRHFELLQLDAWFMLHL